MEEGGRMFSGGKAERWLAKSCLKRGGVVANARSRDLCPGLRVVGGESTASERPAISDGRGGRRASRGHGNGRGRGRDDPCSIRGCGAGHGDDSRGDGGHNHRPARMEEPRPPVAHKAVEPPRLAPGGRRSPAEVAAKECRCGCRYLPGKPQPFREEPPRALLVFSYAMFDGNGFRLFGEFTTFSNFLDE